MYNYLLRFLIILTICYSGNVLAMYEHDENDLRLSKRSSLMSGASYGKLYEDKTGVMTLCFKEQKGTYDHASLVFEMFLPSAPQDLSLIMVHYAQEDDCCGFGGKKKVMIEDSKNTLKKLYRAIEVSSVNGTKKYVPATYTRYASWIIPNDQLIKGLVQAEADSKLNDSYNCVKYVSKIMRTVGLSNVDFVLWWTTPENLKRLVDNHIKPEPAYKQDKLPKY